MFVCIVLIIGVCMF